MKIGDVVHLCGFPDNKMTVVHTEATTVSCMWYDAEGKIQHCILPRGALSPVKEAESKREGELFSALTEVSTKLVQVTAEMNQHRESAKKYAGEVAYVVNAVRSLFKEVALDDLDSRGAIDGMISQYELMKNEANETMARMKKYIETIGG